MFTIIETIKFLGATSTIYFYFDKVHNFNFSYLTSIASWSRGAFFAYLLMMSLLYMGSILYIKKTGTAWKNIRNNNEIETTFSLLNRSTIFDFLIATLIYFFCDDHLIGFFYILMSYLNYVFVVNFVENSKKKIN